MKTVLLLLAVLMGLCLTCKRILENRPWLAARYQLLATAAYTAPAAPQAIHVIA